MFYFCLFVSIKLSAIKGSKYLWVIMQISHVGVVPDGTINGRVEHVILNSRFTQKRRSHLQFDSIGQAKEAHKNIGAPIHVEHTVNLAGQDAFGSSKHCIFVADGHGQEGEQVSTSLFSRGLDQNKKVVQSIPMQLDSHVNTFSQLLGQNKTSEVEYIVRNLILKKMSMPIFRYKKVSLSEGDTILSGNIVRTNGYVCQHSGSTLSLMMFIQGRHRRWSLTISIGDSEAMLVFPQQNRVHVTSLSHSWDNLDLYKRYASYCLQNDIVPNPVCYNRWNDSSMKYRCKDKHGEYKPILVYEKDAPALNIENMEWVSSLYKRKKLPQYKNGTQSIRSFESPHLNWGSCVLIDGKACGQNVATFGDRKERFHTKVPWDLIHIYIHELPINQPVIGIVQSDGVSNEITLEECGNRALAETLEGYLQTSRPPKDDMSVVRAILN